MSTSTQFSLVELVQNFLLFPKLTTDVFGLSLRGGKNCLCICDTSLETSSYFARNSFQEVVLVHAGICFGPSAFQRKFKGENFRVTDLFMMQGGVKDFTSDDTPI